MDSITTPCGIRVGMNTVSYPCSLPEAHTGPHYAVENHRSVMGRERWVAAQAPRPLDEFQGRAQTTAERYTDGATPVPQSAAIRADEEAAWYAQVPPWSDVPREGVPVVESTDDWVSMDGMRMRIDADAVVVETADGAHRRYLATTTIDISDEPQGESALKQREGDQVLPTKSGRVDLQTLVIRDHQDRRQVGIERYGTPLQTFNGRDTLRDAYEEALDLSVYLRSLIETGKTKDAELVNVVEATLISAMAISTSARDVARVVVDTLRDWIAREVSDVG